MFEFFRGREGYRFCIKNLFIAFAHSTGIILGIILVHHFLTIRISQSYHTYGTSVPGIMYYIIYHKLIQYQTVKCVFSLLD